MTTTIVEVFWLFIERIRELRERTRKSRDNLIAKRGTECANVRREFVEDETQDVCGSDIFDAQYRKTRSSDIQDIMNSNA